MHLRHAPRAWRSCVGARPGPPRPRRAASRPPVPCSRSAHHTGRLGADQPEFALSAAAVALHLRAAVGRRNRFPGDGGDACRIGPITGGRHGRPACSSWRSWRRARPDRPPPGRRGRRPGPRARLADRRRRTCTVRRPRTPSRSARCWASPSLPRSRHRRPEAGSPGSCGSAACGTSTRPRVPTSRPTASPTTPKDDGQELTGLAFTHDGATILYVRGGDHGGNWSEAVPPNPDASSARPEVAMWAVPFAGGTPRKVAAGDEPTPSPTSDTVAFLKDGAVWSVALADSAAPAALFFDRGRDRDLRWSPDGRRLAFQSGRGDHAFIGVYRMGSDSVRFLDPSTGLDGSPRWSPDGREVAFVRRHGRGGPPDPILEETPTPWSIRVADAATGRARQVWASPDTPRGSYPQTAGQANLHWMAGGRLTFLADLDGWPHLYSVPADGGAAPTLLTPGSFMVEYVAASPDGRFLVYNANAGGAPGDVDRRHLFRVSPAGGAPRALTSGADLSYYPVVTGDGSGVALVSAGPRRPPLAAVVPAPEARRSSWGGTGSRPTFRRPTWWFRRTSPSGPRTGPGARAAVRPGRERPQARRDLRTRGPAAADAARVALLPVLLEQLRGEPVPGRPRLRRPAR